MGNKQSKSFKNKLTAVVIIGIILASLISAYNLLSFGSKGLLIFIGEVVGFIVLLILWYFSTYGYICRECGNEFNIGLIERCMGKTSDCPSCNSNNIITEKYLDEYIDIDED